MPTPNSAPKPAVKPTVAPKPVTAVVKPAVQAPAPKPAVTAAPKPAAPTVAKLAVTAAAPTAGAGNAAANSMIQGLMSKLGEIELRVSTLEQALAVFQARATPPAETDDYGPLAAFMSEDGSQLNISVQDVQTLDAAACAALAKIVGIKSNGDLRVLKAQLMTALGQMQAGTTAPAQPSRPAAPVPAGEPAAPKFAVGQAVNATYDGQLYEGCEIVAVNRRGRGWNYDVFFSYDQTTVSGMKAEDISDPSAAE